MQSTNVQKSNENTLRECLSNDFCWFWFAT